VKYLEFDFELEIKRGVAVLCLC